MIVYKSYERCAVIAMKRNAERPFYTVTEAAHLLDVSPVTVWRWIETRRLPAYRVGPRRIRIRKEDLMAVVQPARGEEVTAVEKETKRPDIFAHYDPERARKALAQSAGALAGINREALLRDLHAQRDQESTGRPT